MIETPFENIESAHHYVTLLAEQVRQIKAEILEDVALAVREGELRRVDVLRLVDYKLSQLGNQLTTSARVLNDSADASPPAPRGARVSARERR
jgi:hypothetical protein